jgi:NADH-quinone oxidoreductase subunit N
MLIPISAANPLGAKALIFYLIPYSAMSLGAFAIVAARERELGTPVTLGNLAGFAWERPFHGFAMASFMFGMLGFPFTGGFVAKFYAFAAAYRHGWWWLVVVGVVATMVSAVYYLGVVRAMYMRDAAELRLAPAGGSPPRDRLLGVAITACVAVTIGSFFFVQPLIDVARSAAVSLPWLGLGGP